MVLTGWFQNKILIGWL